MFIFRMKTVRFFQLFKHVLPFVSSSKLVINSSYNNNVVIFVSKLAKLYWENFHINTSIMKASKLNFWQKLFSVFRRYIINFGVIKPCYGRSSGGSKYRLEDWPY